MNADKDIHFLQDKIMDIRTAIFANDSVGLFKMPTRIVHVAHVDEEGNIWFSLPRPQQDLSVFEKEFPAQLDFYRKSAGIKLQVSGIASIVPANMLTREVATQLAPVSPYIKSRYIHVRVSITNATYMETDVAKKQKNFWERMNDLIQSLWDIAPEQKFFHFNGTSARAEA
ncbi:MAG: hypothetical protein J0I41_12960 [Filimonas sp.]|nr:hypothetical protein [Filimonas sp.]